MPVQKFSFKKKIIEHTSPGIRYRFTGNSKQDDKYSDKPPKEAPPYPFVLQVGQYPILTVILLEDEKS